MIRVPVLRLSFSAEERARMHQGIDEVLDSGSLSLGKFTEQFEQMFADFVGAETAVSCANGTAAIELILRALDIHGRSVVVPTNTFLATALAVIHSGNRVIFADSDPSTLALDPTDVVGRLEPDTAAIVVVHIGGIVSPAVHDLRRLCDQRGIYLIEDCAHAHGSSLDGVSAGRLGIAGAFSFYPTKVLTTGEGGMVTTDDPELADRVRMIRNHGKNPRLGNRMSELGNNFRLSEITAVLGVEQLRKAPAAIDERQATARYYDRALTEVPELRPLVIPAGSVSTYYKYVAYLPEWADRSAVKKALKDDFGVSLTGEVYADLCHTEPLWERFDLCGCPRASAGPAPAVVDANFPGAEYVSRHHVCLPIYPGLEPTELEQVVRSLAETLRALS